jgi:hypothetical protein
MRKSRFYRQDLRISPLLPQGEGRDEEIEKENVLISHPPLPEGEGTENAFA